MKTWSSPQPTTTRLWSGTSSRCRAPSRTPSWPTRLRARSTTCSGPPRSPTGSPFATTTAWRSFVYKDTFGHHIQSTPFTSRMNEACGAARWDPAVDPVYIFSPPSFFYPTSFSSYLFCSQVVFRLSKPLSRRGQRFQPDMKMLWASSVRYVEQLAVWCRRQPDE